MEKEKPDYRKVNASVTIVSFANIISAAVMLNYEVGIGRYTWIEASAMLTFLGSLIGFAAACAVSR